ncbi:IclR family transcriptional regulator [Streptomyces sp. NTH33]|uniref:IclR family transcriptional regulator n=1 Tax=Streptomyces sp. NTH33 TaxID=1735453 RepID=UPI001C647FB1|nr:IclR family transcriptional regulator [Streptomyces sp. NTH33]
MDKALRLLLLVSARPTGVRVNEASAELGVAPSTAHRLLQMITHHGLAVQDPDTKAYLPGPALLKIGNSREQCVERARPVLRDLADETQETVHLSVLEQSFSVTLFTAEGPHMLRVGDRSGHAIPVWMGAMGRCLLFDHDDAAVRELLPSGLRGPGGAPMADALIEQLHSDREHGFAHHDGVVEPGVSVAAVPVRGTLGTVEYAIGMTYPTSRVPAELLPSAVTKLQAASAAITALLPR